MDNHYNLTAAAGPARSARQADQGGFALLIALIATVIPLLLIMGASSINMTSRMTRLERESNEERALAAAESGIDLAIYMSSTPVGLVSNSWVTRNLGGGLSFRFKPIFLLTNARDDDGNEGIDEPDENLYQVEVIGTYRNTSRRLAAYLGPQPPLPYTVTGALMTMGVPDPLQFEVQGAAEITGTNYGLDGSPTGFGDVAGVSVHTPHTVAEMLTAIPPSDYDNIVGVTPSPSISTTAQPINLEEIQLSMQNSANMVLTNSNYLNLQFGNSEAIPPDYRIIYRAGDVRFNGDCRGAGVMFITGDLRIEGSFRFDGVVYVLGNIRRNGVSTEFNGALLTGPDTDSILHGGNTHVRYSSQTIQAATAVLPTKYVLFNGWQELSRP